MPACIFQLIPSFYKHGLAEKSEETKQELLKNIGNVEQYLTEKKSKYFGGRFQFFANGTI